MQETKPKGLCLYRRLPIACTVLSVSLGCSHCLPSMSMAHGSPPNFLYYCPHVGLGLCLHAIKVNDMRGYSFVKLLASSIRTVVINLFQPLQLKFGQETGPWVLDRGKRNLKISLRFIPIFAGLQTLLLL